MDIPLPQTIETFVRAENSGDTDVMSGCFAPFATMRDDKKQHNHTPTPLEISTSNGFATLRGELNGKFAGSPLKASFHFVLVNDQIASLQIRA